MAARKASSVAGLLGQRVDDIAAQCGRQREQFAGQDGLNQCRGARRYVRDNVPEAGDQVGPVAGAEAISSAIGPSHKVPDEIAFKRQLGNVRQKSLEAVRPEQEPIGKILEMARYHRGGAPPGGSGSVRPSSAPTR
jgi:hypothetical protein